MFKKSTGYYHRGNRKPGEAAIGKQVEPLATFTYIRFLPLWCDITVAVRRNLILNALINYLIKTCVVKAIM